MASSSKKLRSDNDIFLVGKCESELKGAKLPNMKQVLQLFFYNTRVQKLPVKASIKSTIHSTLEFWKKANIPTMTEINCVKKLNFLYAEWKNLSKNRFGIYEKYRNDEKGFREKIENYIFDIAAVDALETMTIEEDKDFLLLQREKGRPGCMAGQDLKLSQKQERKAKLLEEAEKRKRKYQEESREVQDEVASDTDTSENSVYDGVEMDNPAPEVDFLQDQHQGTQGTRGKIHFVDDRMLASMDKWRISDRDAMHLTSATITAVLRKLQEMKPDLNNIKVEDFVFNRTSFQTMRKEYRRRQAKQIIDEFKIPEVFVLHWDGKMLPDMKGKDKVDRLALVITAESEEKLLGIAKLEESCGENIAEGIEKFLRKWKMENLVQIVAFDTTSTNTGIAKGSAYLLESKLGRDLLFLPCRHHISELLIKAVFELNLGKTSAPEVTLFNRFSKNWKNMDINSFKSGILDEAVQKNITAAEIETHKNFCLEALKSHYVRADYKELLQLSLIFIGKEAPNFTQLRLPGATIHARFMSKAIYCYKIFLLREQLKMTSSELKGIRNICIFLTRIYVSYWFRCVNAVSAPRQDLQFINAISYFDLNVSNALLSKIRNHLWYLSEEAVALGFFDEMIPIEVKRKMVEALRNHDDDNDKVIPKRLNLSLEQVKSFENKDVSSFVTSRTKRFFHRLQIDVTFFELDPSIWKDQEEYCTAKRICQHLTVVNDPAERAVKLITDFNRALTYDEEDKQYLLQVVEHYRKNFSSHKKSSLV